MTYDGRHYTQASLVDLQGVDTGFIDPRTVNWLAALFTAEATRFAQALFGASGLQRFHMTTRTEYPRAAKETPFLRATPLDAPRSEEFQNPPHVGVTHKYGDDQDKTVRLDWPEFFDLRVEWAVYHRDEYPVFDLEQKLMNLSRQGLATVVRESIPYSRDTATYSWEDSEYQALVTGVGVHYRNVPLVWGTDVSWGSIIKSVALAIYSKAGYDDHGIDEDLL